MIMIKHVYLYIYSQSNHELNIQQNSNRIRRFNKKKMAEIKPNEYTLIYDTNRINEFNEVQQSN